MGLDRMWDRGRDWKLAGAGEEHLGIALLAAGMETMNGLGCIAKRTCIWYDPFPNP